MEEAKEATPIKSFSLEGKFGTWANIIIGIILVGGLVAMFFIFPFPVEAILNGDISEFLIYMLFALLGIGIAVVTIFGGLLTKYLTLKKFGGGKCKIHFGKFIEVKAEFPVSKCAYIMGEIVYLIIPVILAILSFFFWGVALYLSLLFLVPNLVTYAITSVFILKQPKGSRFLLKDGKIGSYK
ncbi:MAG: hypothetical protein FWD89_02765 [Firmicutes bacterium]|nr:hypothetical protein [Bacillota bacterium]